jgi:glucokinase
VADDYIKQKPRYLKPSADIVLINSQVNLAVAAVQYAVDIKVDSGYVGGDMALSVSASDGLYIVGGDIAATKTLIKGVVNNVYQVMATETGRYLC